jgi:hypothetical protein
MGLVGAPDDDRAVLVRAVGRGAGSGEHLQRLRRGVPVVVVGADPDEPDPRGEHPVELRVLVGRAVVCHLDDVDRVERAGWRGPAESPLGVLPEVAEEHRADAP